MVSIQSTQTRQAKLSAALRDAGFDALMLNPGPSLTYLTGLHFHLSERPVVVTFIPQKPVVIVLPELEKAKLADLPYPIHAFPYGEDPSSWVGVFNKAAEAAGLGKSRIGVEPRGLRLLELEFVSQATPKADFLPADQVIASLRMYKDAGEIASMQKAVDIAQAALEATLPRIKTGVSEAEIASELSMKLLKLGSNPRLPFAPIVSGGPNSANPHASPSDRPLAEGDLLVIDYGANVDGYFSDITRTFAIGKVDPEYHHIAKIVLEANQAGRAAIKPGVTASSVDAAAREVIEDSGYGKNFFHRTGHGLGLEGHEEPYIRGDSNLILELGMTFTVEPGIYLPGRNGVRIEDDVVVTPDGVHSLTTLPRELINLDG